MATFYHNGTNYAPAPQRQTANISKSLKGGTEHENNVLCSFFGIMKNYSKKEGFHGRCF